MSLVQLSRVNLHYSTLAYREASLKAYTFKLLGFKRQELLPSVHALNNISLDIKLDVLVFCRLIHFFQKFHINMAQMLDRRAQFK